MIVECKHCGSKVDGEVLAQQGFPVDEFDPPFRVALVQCPVCRRPMLAGQEQEQVDFDKWDWGDAKRLWPDPEAGLARSLPYSVSASMVEARTCYKAGAYYACAVMCRRALEAICSECKTKKKFLAGGLRELLEAEIIDRRIFQWAEALREQGNIGAHVTKETISGQDARDLLDFANAICDYVFVLTEKFRDFMDRKGKPGQG